MADPAASSEPYIRAVEPSDSPALSRICLLTGDAGQSAEPLHASGELIGLVYAEPYAHLPTGLGFVLVDGADVVGYALATHDTRAFERAAREAWFPRVRAKYAFPPEANEGATDADK